MNNKIEIDNMLKDFKANKEYFKNIVTAKSANELVSNQLSIYKKALQKIISMVNVTKMIDLCQLHETSSNYRVVLTSYGIRERYVSGTYSGQSSSLSNDQFIKNIDIALDKLFKLTELKDLQKNKILPLKTMDFSFLKEIDGNKKAVILGVSVVYETMESIIQPISIPSFSKEGREYYSGALTNMSLLSIRTQIEPTLKKYLEERSEAIEKIKAKTRELETLFPMVFLFGDE